MKKSSISMAIVLLISACTSNTPQPNSLPNADKVATIVAGTISAITMQATTEISATATSTPFPGISVSFDKVNLVIPSMIASGINGNIIPRSEGDSAPWDVAPEHIELDLDNYILQGTRLDPKIYVYPAEEYASLQDAIATNIAELDNIIENPNQPLTDEILPTHLVNAARLFTSNRKVVDFQNGQGVRYITQHAQFPAPINNHDLFYYFSGLTNDKRFYITVILPISTSQLPETAELGATQPAGGLYLPPDLNNMNESNVQEYYSNLTALLDNTQPGDFIPDIDSLDALVSSINVIEGK